MRKWKGATTVVLLCLVSLILLSCAGNPSQAATSGNQPVTVQRGNISINITAVGNLALSNTVDLPFDIPASFDKTVALTVQQVLVQAGDTVTEGQLLANLDTSTWNDQVSALQDKLTAAERNVTTKQRALTAAQRQITSKNLSVTQAQLNIQSAQNALDNIAQVKEAKDFVDKAQRNLDIANAIALRGIAPATSSGYQWYNNANAGVQPTGYGQLQDELERAQAHLADVLNGSSNGTTLPDDVVLAVNKAKLAVDQANVNLADAQVAVEDAQTAIDDAKTAVSDAQKSLQDAQNNLDEANSASPEIKAPLSGFISNVNVVGGTEVKKGTIAMTIADPTKFEANIMVNETNIPNITVGGNATVAVSSLPGVVLPAKLTQISPTATIQSGVVNYQVKVEIQSLQPMVTTQPRANSSSNNFTSGQFPNRSQSGNISSSANATGQIPNIRQGAASGNLTQAQIQGLINQRQQSAAGQSQQTTASTTPTTVQLKQGMTVTVSIIVQQRNNVLEVPNQAITLQQGQTYVQVQKADGTTEQRQIQTGINNSQYTEVISGLTEGEQVIVPKSTAPSSTSSTTQPRTGGNTIFIPGIGGAGR